MDRSTHCFVSWSKAYSGSERKRMNFIFVVRHSERGGTESRNPAAFRRVTPRDVSTLLDMTTLMRAHHRLAPIAQIRMCFTRADSRPMAPATGTFFVWRFRHRSACFFALVNRQITQNKKFLQFVPWEFFCDIGIRIQNHARFQRVADYFFLACALDRLPYDATQSQKLLNLLNCFPAAIL